MAYLPAHHIWSVTPLCTLLEPDLQIINGL
jgi:hypothetical protein